MKRYGKNSVLSVFESGFNPARNNPPQTLKKNISTTKINKNASKGKQKNLKQATATIFEANERQKAKKPNLLFQYTIDNETFQILYRKADFDKSPFYLYSKLQGYITGLWRALLKTVYIGDLTIFGKKQFWIFWLHAGVISIYPAQKGYTGDELLQIRDESEIQRFIGAL